jgi:hypothetical protein
MNYDNIKDIEFLANKSNDFLTKQLSSYGQKQTNSGTLMAVIFLFVPFFLNGLDDSIKWIKIASIIPIGLFAWAMILFITILRTKSLDVGFHVDKFQELLHADNYQKVLLYEIGANSSSFRDNKILLDNIYESFHKAIKVTIIAVLSAVLLLVINKFDKPDKTDMPLKIKIVD